MHTPMIMTMSSDPNLPKPPLRSSPRLNESAVGRSPRRSGMSKRQCSRAILSRWLRGARASHQANSSPGSGAFWSAVRSPYKPMRTLSQPRAFANSRSASCDRSSKDECLLLIRQAKGFEYLAIKRLAMNGDLSCCSATIAVRFRRSFRGLSFDDLVDYLGY